MLKDKTVILGVTGGIAAYKAATLVSRLKDLGADVWVVMTKEATKLISPITFRTLSGNPVITDLFADELATLPVPHISLAAQADLILIAPSTANIIGKIAHGLADDPLTTIVMAATAPKLLAPAMNSEMWQNPIVARNVEGLKVAGYRFIGPDEGKLACGAEGIGRMVEPEEIVKQVVKLLSGVQDFQGKKLLITAGGTREAIDPIRYITNRSSGKMGYALAEAASARGAEVTLVSGPTSLAAPEGVKLISIESAQEMHAAVREHKNEQNVIIMAAAVADYRPAITFWQKLKKEHKSFQLVLAKTADILAELGQNKNGTRLVGFAAETEKLHENGLEKLRQKNLDLVIANGTEAFEADKSTVLIISKDGTSKELAEMSKKEIAGKILDAILRL